MPERRRKDIPRYVTELVRLNRECLEITQRLLDGAPWPDPEILTEGLTNRGRLLHRIREIERILPTHREQDRVVLDGLAEDQKPDVNRNLAVLNQLAADLAAADGKLRDAVQRESADTGNEMKKFNQSHTVLKAYAAYQAPQRFLVDRKG